MKDYIFKVWVNCFTYNHSAYICDAMDGFCIQQTNFPYVCTIVDDHSTDGEPDIIKYYLQKHFNLNDSKNEETDDYHLIFAQHNHNPNCFFAVLLLKYNHYKKKSKYVYLQRWENIKYKAICEGDDFWTSPYKLQKQIDYLDTHPNHSLCFHANYQLFKDGTKKVYSPYKKNMDECPMKDMILGGGGFMATNSMLYISKKGDRSSWPAWTKNSQVGDCPLMLTLAERGKVGYICELMSCYRMASEGSWSQRILMNKEKYKEHIIRSNQLWEDFDKWTNYKYHKYIEIKKRKNLLHYMIKSNPFLNKLVQFIMKYT